jgi:hypothetical protein
MAAAARGGLRRPAGAGTKGQVEAVQRTALQIEREQIRRAYDNDLISRDTMRTMRDNVAAIEYDLGGD